MTFVPNSLPNLLPPPRENPSVNFLGKSLGKRTYSEA